MACVATNSDRDAKLKIDVGGRGGYGYMWWVAAHGKHFPSVKLPDGSFSARGNGGQYILIIPQFDMVIVNFYDFTAAVEADPSLSSAKKAIDIGGPCMARAAAKNWENVTVVVDPEDYSFVLDDIRQHGGVSREVRYMLATKVFRAEMERIGSRPPVHRVLFERAFDSH